ncbi:hypothetical protein [Dehalogenimonas sp. 4OHTPN]|uniref:DUF2892 domain-containing protein n=1 Tax=Dehalogenimonas sp. 4OHTPN TaxID=3166643 RepID=A0AAU8GDT3_9CHLR
MKAVRIVSTFFGLFFVSAYGTQGWLLNWLQITTAVGLCLVLLAEMPPFIIRPPNKTIYSHKDTDE